MKALNPITDFLMGVFVATGLLLFAIIANVVWYRKWIIVFAIVYFGIKSYLYGR